MAGFRVNSMHNRGFQIQGSRYIVSVQFGPGNYASFRDDWDNKHVDEFSATAETAVIDIKTQQFVPQDGEDVRGWQTPAEVAALIAKYID